MSVRAFQPQKRLVGIALSFMLTFFCSQTTWALFHDHSQLIHININHGDTLYGLFKAHHIPQKELQAILKLGHDVQPLKALQAGQTLEIELDDDQVIQSLTLVISPYQSLELTQINGVYASIKHKHHPNIQYQSIGGTIEHSLYKDAIAAGLPENLLQPLVNLFHWQAPVEKAMHKGDTFKVTFERLNGNKTGHIIAAEIKQKHHVYQAIRWQAPHEFESFYYTPEGESLTPKFLRFPIKYTHISDRFNPHRRHPILHKVRPHWGVDFAARSGTPIKATGDGKITYMGRKGGFGRFIEIKHSDKYYTRYAHLLRYKKSLKKGTYVKRGQVIGYVGRSGLSTGSHLHYEIRVNGKAINPLTISFPQTHAIKQQDMGAFNQYKEQFWPITTN